MEKILDFFGLTGNEKKVIQVVLSQGFSTTTDITKGSGISRPNCYDILNKLIERGLVTRIFQNKKTLYKANKVNENILNQKEKELNLLKKDFERYNQELELTEKDFYDVEIFSGKKILKGFMFSLLDAREILVFGAEGKFENQHQIIFEQWMKMIKDKRIKVNAIYNKDFRKHRDENVFSSILAKYCDRKLSSEVTTVITDNTVSLIHWKKVPLIIHLKDKEIAKSYRQEFNQLWKLAKD